MGAIVNEQGLYIGFRADSPIPLPPETWPPIVPMWDGASWQLVEDHRGEVVYCKANGAEYTIDALGPIPDEYTTTAPNPYSIWDDEAGVWRWSCDRWLDEYVRPERDVRINAVMWRYERWEREDRLGLTHHDDRATLDAYVQALCDLPEGIDPEHNEWPEEPWA
jgi:hypothetical protein